MDRDTKTRYKIIMYFMKSSLVSLKFLKIFPSPKDMFIDFRERGGWRERKRNISVRKKHQSVASCLHPDGGWTLPPRYVLCTKTRPTTSWCMGWHYSQQGPLTKASLLPLNCQICLINFKHALMFKKFI